MGVRDYDEYTIYDTRGSDIDDMDNNENPLDTKNNVEQTQKVGPTSGRGILEHCQNRRL